MKESSYRLFFIFFLLLSTTILKGQGLSDIYISIDNSKPVEVEDASFSDLINKTLQNALVLTARMTNKFSWSQRFKVVSEGATRKAIIEAQKKSKDFDDCSTEECSIELGKLMQATYIVTRDITSTSDGYYGKKDDQAILYYDVELKLWRIEDGEELGSYFELIYAQGSTSFDKQKSIKSQLENAMIQLFNSAFSEGMGEPTLPMQTAESIALEESLGSSPIVFGINRSVVHGRSLTIILSGQDPDDPKQEDKLQFFVRKYPDHGSFEQNGNQILYTPNSDYIGIDTIEYMARDKVGLNSIAEKIHITVTNKNPNAKDSSVNVQENGSVSFKLNVQDEDGDDLSFNIITNPLKGTLNKKSKPGEYIYTPKSNFEGEDSITYHVYDGISYSNEATVFINIIELQRPPTTENITTKIKHGKVLQLQLLGRDEDGDSFVFLINENPKNGQLNLVGDKITYRSEPGFVGNDRFTYRAKDEKGDYSNISTVSINVHNSKPVAVRESYSVKAGESVQIILKASDNDPEDKARLAYVLQKRPRYGTFERYEAPASGLSPNIYIYTPFKDFSGPDQLVFYANDGAQNSSPVIIDITVTEDRSSSPVVTSKTSEPKPKPKSKPTKKQIVVDKEPPKETKKDDDEDGGGMNMTLLLGGLLLLLLLGAAGGGGGGGGAAATGGIDIGIFFP